MDHADHRCVERCAGRTGLAHARGQGRCLRGLSARNFKGKLPAGLEEIAVDTSLVTTRRADTTRQGRTDYAAVNKIQDGYKLIPSRSGEGKDFNYTPPAAVPVKPGVDAKTPVPSPSIQDVGGAVLRSPV